MKINSIKVDKLKIIYIAFILSFSMAFNISSMEEIETEKVREKEEIQEKSEKKEAREKRKNIFEDEQELSRAKSVKLDENNYLQGLPQELQTMIAEFVAGSVNTPEEIRETIRKISSFAQAHSKLSEIIKDYKFQKYLLNLVHKNFPKLNKLEAKILIGTPYWANNLKERIEEDEALKDQLGKELIKASYYGDVNTVKFLLKAGVDPEFSVNLSPPYYNNGDALLNAVTKKHEAVVRLLIQSGVKLDLLNRNNEDALIIASMMGLKEIVKLLLESNEDIDLNAVIDLIKHLINEHIRNRLLFELEDLQGVLEMVKDYKAKKDSEI